MQKIYKAIISLILTALLVNAFPFKLFADTSTYFIPEDWTLVAVNSINNNERYVIVPSNNIRVTCIDNGSNYTYGFVALSSGLTSQYKTNLDGNPSTIYLNSSIVIDGISYYYTSLNYPKSNWTSEYNGLSLNGSIENSFVYYTFGAGAVDPSPSFNYGELIVGFHTNFSASGTTNNYTITSNTNLDTIEWENIDSNGNDLQNKGINVQIRAVPIIYSANSKSALDLLGFQDAVVNYNDGLILWTGNFNDNHKSFIWNDVINQLQTSNPAFTITSLLTGSVWTRYGWIYQIRYNDVLNDYSSEWQTIYNSTSIKVSDSEKIVNQYYYHYPSGVGSDDQDIFHDINTVNNTTNNWYVNDVPVDPDASWLDALIQAIAEILGKILDFFSSIFDGLVDLILGLFGDINPADSFFNWFSNLFNGIGEIDLTLPQFNLPNTDLTSFNRLVQETLDIFSFNNFGFVIFIPLLLLIIKAVF